MTQVEPGDTTTPERVGDRLRKAREAQGLSLAEVGSRTRVPLRHLEAIEATDLGQLPSPTYAVGFSRAYARAVGLNDADVARDVRAELNTVPRAPEYEPYQMADPARVPSRGLAIIGLGLAIALVVLAGLYFATDLFRGGGTAPVVAVAPATTTAPVVPAPVASPTPVTGPVRLSADTDEVWLRVYDADNKTLYLGILKPGDSFTVPADAKGPKINVGRPDELRITVGDTAIPALGDGKRPIKDVPVDAAALLARVGQAGAAVSTPAAAPSPAAAAPSPAASATARATPRAPRPAPSAPAAAPTASVDPAAAPATTSDATPRP